MNSKKVYACYNMMNDINDLEFWTANKKLYKEYMAIFGPHLEKGCFEHRILPMSLYDDFKARHSDCELKVHNLNSQKSMPFISTELDIELFNGEEILTEFLQLQLLQNEIVELLPPRIKAIIRQSNYMLYVGGKLIEADSWREQVDMGKLMTVYQSIRYSGDESIIDPDIFNADAEHTRTYNRI